MALFQVSSVAVPTLDPRPLNCTAVRENWRCVPSWSTLVSVWNAYRDDDPSRRSDNLDENAAPGPAPAGQPGFDPVELVVDGETFEVTRRADSPRTFDFDWTSHPDGYGFGASMNVDWDPDREELIDQIRSFLAEIDPETGYLAD
ncbi:MAG TPA: hypothetical protein VEX66_00710 [Microlunatus sp.]|nr:hypothetical protein [Microlunatus sp.]